jgi:F-type H+-transporting ATPase subunit a
LSLRRSWRALTALAVGCLLAVPTFALGQAEAEEDKFDPSLEFELDPYISLEIGPLDLSINKAVLYLLLASVICIGVGIFVVRGGLRQRPTGAQNLVELVYEFTERQIARPTLTESVFSRYFPYIATLFMFLAVSNVISFIPLPVSHESGTLPFGLPDLGLYAATANINVTLALTIVVFIAFNYEGVKAHGALGYLKTLVPDAPTAIKPFIFALELLSQLLRLVSLSVRLFANLLAGHLLIIMCAGFMVLLGNFAGLIAIPVGVFFYTFEWVLIAGLQAFIFAMLSGIYIGFAVQSDH